MKTWVFAWAFAFLLLPTVAQAASEDPRSVVENTVEDIIQVLKNRKDMTRLSEEDRAAITAAIGDRFDYRKMARGSIGRAWRELAESDKQDFSDVFRELLERSYGNRLADYRDQTIRYGEAKINEKRHTATVKSWVIDGEKEIPVYYRLYQDKSGTWHVYDIKIEGVSLVGTYRKQFKSALKNGGFQKLLADLRQKVEKLKQQDNA